jgi:hypothetical protein
MRRIVSEVKQSFTRLFSIFFQNFYLGKVFPLFRSFTVGERPFRPDKKGDNFFFSFFFKN